MRIVSGIDAHHALVLTVLGSSPSNVKVATRLFAMPLTSPRCARFSREARAVKPFRDTRTVVFV